MRSKVLVAADETEQRRSWRPIAAITSPDILPAGRLDSGWWLILIIILWVPKIVYWAQSLSNYRLAQGFGHSLYVHLGVLSARKNRL